jgi:hypothetical protein
MRVLTIYLLTSLLSFGTLNASGQGVNDVCDTIPSQCIVNGQVDKECLCKIWCAEGCGGSACNCDILPLDDKERSKK